LRAPVELPDGAIRDRALAEVLAASRRLELVAPVGAQIRELALGSRLGQRVALRRRFLQRRARASTPSSCEADHKRQCRRDGSAAATALPSKYTADPWPTESYSFPATGRGPS